ncbi:MAG: tRNA(His) guanylyltransferase Thg1 family protein [Methanobacteriaceae archaeon]|nr:tRNA(His) guanylyltransferase Thg1 family protein [Methanobacteriaceae archaeon]
MNECEIFSNLKIPCGSRIVMRIDGRNFSQLSQRLKFHKPYDTKFADKMVLTSIEFFKEFNPQFIFTFSDEINILLSEIPFSGRIEKLNSVFSSFISGAFTKTICSDLISNNLNQKLWQEIKPISFDSRVIPLSKSQVADYFQNRQNEAWRNCINGYAYWSIREDYGKEKAIELLRGKKSKDLHEILFSKGINITEVPAWQRRGIGLYKKETVVEGFNPIRKKKVKSKRLKLFIDKNLPIFDNIFFNSLNIV